MEFIVIDFNDAETLNKTEIFVVNSLCTPQLQSNVLKTSINDNFFLYYIIHNLGWSGQSFLHMFMYSLRYWLE